MVQEITNKNILITLTAFLPEDIQNPKEIYRWF